jgi:hypothetical protein
VGGNGNGQVGLAGSGVADEDQVPDLRRKPPLYRSWIKGSLTGESSNRERSRSLETGKRATPI